jgi:tight adherence protein B
MSPIGLFLMVMIAVLAIGGAAFAFAGAGNAKSQKRLAGIAKPQASGRGLKGQGVDAGARRKNVQALIKDIEKKKEEKKEKITLRRRLEMAGLKMKPRTYWIVCGCIALATIVFALIGGQSPLVMLLAGIGAGFGLPRWTLGFLKNRREKAFTKEFANAIDVIVRSVKSGLPTNEALKIVAREVPNPVGNEFNLLVESMKVGVTLEQALKKMTENMPTPEVNFFAIVMTIQQKSGGNLSEALSNLSGVLRDRKRLRDKIKAMSSEAKASAMIIGSLPPGVMMMVYLTTPAYMAKLFTTQIGNLMLAGGAMWMGLGILVMRGMINFKH